ncbi:hypothetical protein NOMA109596_19320 [Nocardioides marinus]
MSGSGSGSSGPRASSSARSSRSSSRSGSSKGARRRRCGSARRAATRTSSPVTSVRPHQAAWATAVRAVTMSARNPSTSRAAQTSATASSTSSPRCTSVHADRAAATRAASRCSAAANRATNPAGSASKASRRRTTSTRRAGSRGAATSTDRPNRSSSCGRSSPSSGFMVPTRTKRAGWVTENPSRSTVARPVAAASSSRSTRWSCRRLTSSTYSRPRCALASSPGSYSARPADRARSRWIEPVTRSSPAPTGSSTSRTGRLTTGVPSAKGPSGETSPGSRGSVEKRSPSMTSTGGRTAARPRTAVVLAVPFSPRTRTPPTSGATAASSRARTRSSDPTTAESG